MGDSEQKPLVLAEYHNREFVREVNRRFSNDHLEQDIFSCAPFLNQHNVNYAIYHEPRIIYLTHIPASMHLNEILDRKSKGTLDKISELEDAQGLLRKLSCFLMYKDPAELRKKLENEFFERYGNRYCELDKALLIENLTLFQEHDYFQSSSGERATALGKALEEGGFIQITRKPVIISLTSKRDPSRLALPNEQDYSGLSELARRETQDRRVFDLLYFRDMLSGKKQN